MRLDIAPEVFSNPRNEVDLMGLVERALKGKFYFRIVDDAADGYIAWLKSQSRRVQSAWEHMKEWGERDASSRRLVTLQVRDDEPTNWTNSELTLKDAIWLVDQPFHVLLENGRNDRAFLLAMIPPEDRACLERLEEAGRLVYSGAGGIGELKKIVEDVVSGKKNKKQSYFALFDSDAPRKGMPSNQAKSVIAACDKIGIKHHCLARRAIENYLPLSALEDFSIYPQDLRDRRLELIHALSKLSEEQRYHFRMKSGLPEKIEDVNEAALYAAVPEADRPALRKGFSDKLADHFSLADRQRLWLQILRDRAHEEMTGTATHLMATLGAPHYA